MQGWEIPIGNVSPIVGAKDEGEGGGEGGANGAERHRQKDGCLPATEIPIPIPNTNLYFTRVWICQIGKRTWINAMAQ